MIPPSGVIPRGTMRESAHFGSARTTAHQQAAAIFRELGNLGLALRQVRRFNRALVTRGPASRSSTAVDPTFVPDIGVDRE